jgi:hypothetical protein
MCDPRRQFGCNFKSPVLGLGGIDWSCHNSDGKDQCDCLKFRKRRKRTKCCFYGRPVEPLACDLPRSQLNPQAQSPLYGTIPIEIRFHVWEYALTDNCILPPNPNKVFRQAHLTDANIAKSDIATALLQTCKVAYLETYRLPMQPNGKTGLLVAVDEYITR